MITWFVLGSIVFILLTSLYVGWKDSEQIDILIEIKYLSNPWFNLGISFESIPQEDHVQEELVIGFFFVNVVFVFFKEIDA